MLILKSCKNAKCQNHAIFVVLGISVTSVSFRSGAFEEASASNSESLVSAPAPAGPSALVLETVEHGFKRHYLIPSHLVRGQLFLTLSSLH